MDLTDAIDKLGGTGAVARLCGITPGAVSLWKARGEIPRAWHLRIHRECQARGIDYDPEPPPHDHA